MAVASTSASSSASFLPQNLPIVCEDCFISYGDFCYLYTGDTDKLIKYCQNHGVILSEKLCDSCNCVCRIDINKLCFQCDKSYITQGRRRKRCNFKVSIFKNTWFHKSGVDIETNLKFVVLWLQDWFAFNSLPPRAYLTKRLPHAERFRE